VDDGRITFVGSKADALKQQVDGTVLKALGTFPSMFPMHTLYWGDWYKQIVGPEQAAWISPVRSILNTGLHATSHTDAPVALPNLMQVVWATVNRTSRSGTLIGPDERVTPFEAMKMITLGGAGRFGDGWSCRIPHDAVCTAIVAP
jgi:predicted amidohydrolase YtcJ